MPSIVPGSGKVLKHANIALIFWGGGWARSPQISAEELTSVFSAILATPYMAKMAQYNRICNASIVRVLLDTSQEFPEQINNTPGFHQSELEAMIAGHIDDGSLPGPNSGGDPFYMVVSELSVVCIETAPQGAAGFHTSFVHGGATVHYAWVSDSGSLTSGNPIPKTFVHELMEACSDPELDSFKRGSDGQEIGDICNANLLPMPNITSANAPAGIQVQNYFSDLDNACVLPTSYSLKWWGQATGTDLSHGLKALFPQGGSIRSLIACGNPLRPAGSGISISSTRDELGGVLAIDGSRFTPGGTAFLAINYVPNRTLNFERFAGVSADGTFHFSEHFAITTSNPADASGEVSIMAMDLATGNLVIGKTSADLWVA
jgi:hypothetical protein